MTWLTPDRRRLLGIVLLVQAIVWLGIIPLFDAETNSIDYVKITGFEHAEVEDPAWETVASADFEETEPVLRICCDAGYHAVRMTFDLDEVPEEGLGLIHELYAPTFEIRLNDVLIYEEGSLDLDAIGFEGLGHRAITPLPSAVLREGENELVYTIAQKEGWLASTASYSLIASQAELDRVFGHRLFMLNEYKFISITIGYFVALLAFLGWVRGDRQPYLFWLGTLATLWAFGLHQQKWHDLPLPADWRALLMGVLLIALAFAWVMTINAWGPGRVRRVGLISAVLMAILTAASIAAYLYQLSHGEILISAEIVVFIATALGGLGFIGLLLAKLPKISRTLHWEFAIFFAMAVLLLRELAIRIFDLPMILALDYVLPLLLVALAAAFFARNIRLFRSSEQINALLQEQLDERTAQLAVAHEREKVLVAEQAYQEERQRILRDMHDGLGSSLMSMLLAARRGKADPERVANGLQGVIDEMRLLIDSMDTVGESLQSALSLFRNRAEERVPESGFSLTWEDRSDGQLPELPPRTVLQVFRVMQEALTNALKHSTGRSITIRVEPGVISVIDDGDSFDGPRDGGRGLENMAARSRQIGGDFTIGREEGKTVARITLPTS
ncbi:ATP-binding protein [Erythrobacter sp. HKB08]|uniref:sensor histidine kinase n=1 Tax=Erythrobacter sp. HKB08 TaxID=2502843 RepID=UPI001008C6A1|nr:ATP-binding protein [Erythrobacter sp. HKB08]